MFWALLLAQGLWAQSDTTDEKTVAQPEAVMMKGTYYSDRFVGRKTASGDVFRQNQYTAAHKTIPFGTFLRVTNPETGREVVVRVNDRCPRRNVLDMTKLAVFMLGIKGSRPVEVVELDEETGYEAWMAQDTNAISDEDYLAFKDRGKARPRVAARQKGTSRRKAETVQVVVQLPADTTSVEMVPDTSLQQDADTILQETVPVKKPQYIAETTRGQLYDLDLCTVGSRQAAIRVAERLPQTYRDKAVMNVEPLNKQVHVILILKETRSGAIKVQSQLYDSYPDSYLVPHKEDETAVEK